MYEKEIKQLAERFDDMIDIFRDKEKVDYDDIEEMMIGWIDYKHSKMGKLEQKIKATINGETISRKLLDGIEEDMITRAEDNEMMIDEIKDYFKTFRKTHLGE